MPKPDSERRIVRVAFPPKLHDALLRAAKKSGVTYSEIVRRAVARELGTPELGEMPPAHRPRKEKPD